jgi:hypothetical protein
MMAVILDPSWTRSRIDPRLRVRKGSRANNPQGYNLQNRARLPGVVQDGSRVGPGWVQDDERLNRQSVNELLVLVQVVQDVSFLVCV